MSLHTSWGDRDFANLTLDAYQDELDRILEVFLAKPFRSHNLQTYSISLGFPLFSDTHVIYSMSSDNLYERNISLGFSLIEADYPRINEISTWIIEKYEMLFAGLKWGLICSAWTIQTSSGTQKVLIPKYYNGMLRGVFSWDHLTANSESPLEFLRFFTHELLRSGHTATNPLGYRSHNIVTWSTPPNSPLERPISRASSIGQELSVPGEDISDKTTVLLARFLK